ncbi:NADH dehydrogenase [ubiquinone] 1 alpha subcomplex assembly factor 6 [Entomortierella parvispora]|uniref:NADH dehydrogenase [ubiquinone] 1 alpha subcomplex assembly factor 6 n=1 Tax=Entomortierella parvispora TaxID=205924 RepID=A0A9P3HIZ2_9FUNG|nr:NADH dehydrogenase [ubiquinone] 1 alpha subcomplex assembly factor 6 [Entomortierella parvispora]
MRSFLGRSARASLASVQTTRPLALPLVRALATKAHVHDHNCGHDHAHDHDHSHDHAPKQSPFTLGANSIPGRPTRTKKARELIPRPTGAIEYCENLVRKADYEGFLCTQFFPKHQQQTQMALRAFNIELASIRESVSNTDIGRMRMQFWRDSIVKIFDGIPPQQPVALALAYAIQEQELYHQKKLEHQGEQGLRKPSASLSDPEMSQIWFKRMITERELNLSDPQFVTLAQMESYCENTFGSLLYLQLESVGVKSLEADHAASHLAKAMGIATMLRAFPFHMHQNRMVLPAEITAKFNLSQEALFRNPTITAALQDATHEVATAAHVHLATAQSYMDNLPREALPVLMPSIPTEAYLTRLEKADFNPLAPEIQQREWFLPAKMWYRYRQGKLLNIE